MIIKSIDNISLFIFKKISLKGVLMIIKIQFKGIWCVSKKIMEENDPLSE